MVKAKMWEISIFRTESGKENRLKREQIRNDCLTYPQAEKRLIPAPVTENNAN